MTKENDTKVVKSKPIGKPLESPHEIVLNAGKGELSARDIADIVAANPQMTPRLGSYFLSLIKLSDGMKATQLAAIDAVKESVIANTQTLNELAKSSKSDKTRLKIGALVIEQSKLINAMTLNMIELNRSNNKSWKYMFFTLIIGAGLGGAAAYAASKDGNGGGGGAPRRRP